VVDGGLTYGCTQSFQVESAVPGGPRFPNEALRCAAAYSVVERAVGDREIDSRQAGCATPRRPARASPKGSARDPRRSSRRANPRGTGCAIAARESGRRAAHLPSNEGALDREKLRRVTAAEWKRSRRVSPNRPTCTAKGTSRYRRGNRDRSVRGRSSRAWVGPTSPHSAKAIRRSGSARRETRRSPVSAGSNPRKSTLDEESGR